MRNKKHIYILVLILIMGIATGCDLDQEKIEIDQFNKEEVVVSYSPEKGGELIIPLTNFKTLNPLMTENNSYYYFSKLIFESLFEFDEKLNVEGQLVKSYKVNEDGRTIEIKLRENVLWHDGEKLTSEDVKFTVNTIKYANVDSTYNKMFTDALGSFSPSDIRRIVEVNIIDEDNFIITFDRSFSNNLEVLTFPVIPKHIYAEESVNNNSYIKALTLEDYNPIGTGPFRFENYEKMKEITLLANEHYRNDRPYLDKITGKIFDNEEDILRSFEVGQIDLATTIGIDWEKYSQNEKINSLEFISSNYEFIGFNFEKEIFQEESGKNLRKSIAYAINIQEIIEDVYLGHSTEVHVPIHPNSWLLSDTSNGLGYNLNMAKEELNKLPYKDSNEDGILEYENGEDVTINLLTNTLNPARFNTAKKIKKDLREIGLDVRIFPEVEPSEEISIEDVQKQWEEVNEILASGEYDLALLGWQLSVIPDLSFAFHSSQIDYNTNFIKYSNEAMDELLEDLFLNGNRADKQNKYVGLQNLLVDELPYISLFFKNKSLLVNSKVMGELKPSFHNLYQGIETLYIPKDLR